MVDRNPYALLGIRFGASRDEATRAFARKAKGRRRQRTAGPDLTELTWALNQVAEVIREPRTALSIYRVPADPGALEAVGEGVLRPPPERMPRTSGPSAEAWSRLVDAAREEAIAVQQQEIASTASLPHR